MPAYQITYHGKVYTENKYNKYCMADDEGCMLPHEQWPCGNVNYNANGSKFFCTKHVYLEGGVSQMSVDDGIMDIEGDMPKEATTPTEAGYVSPGLQAAMGVAPAATAPAPKPRVSPTYVTASMAANVAEYGGKATSLAKLMRMGLNVPPAWVFPCSASIERPLLAFPKQWQSNTQLYSVRSGAPVSMPGMLKTELNVHYNGLRKAIRKVWDSWNEPHAVQYRNDNNISHAMGTACIVQQMPIGKVTYSGVAFTSNPTDYYARHTYDPTVECVAGLGEALVSGENSGVAATEALLGKPDYSLLMSRLETIHGTYGPSDVEWCLTAHGYLYFLQWRPIKFTLPAEVVPDGDREVVITGKSIAATTIAMGPLGLAGQVGTPNGAVLTVTAFKPEIYPLMIKSAAIVTGQGGTLCHAAIVGRAMNKPTLSGIDWASIAGYEGKMVRVNGATGTISIPTAQDLLDWASASVATSDTAPPAPLKPQTIDLSLRNREWNASLLLVRFYKAIDERDRGVITEERFAAIVAEIAKLFATYQYIICACESRYAPGHVPDQNFGVNVKGHPERDKFEQRLVRMRELGLPMPMVGQANTSRVQFAGDIEQPKDMATALEALDHISYVFNDMLWCKAGGRTSAGGKKWGAITNHLRAYLRGEIPDMLYVDANFNLQHNNGRYFNKFSWMVPAALNEEKTEYTANIDNLLNAKARSTKALLTVAGKVLKEPMVVAESLFGEGVVPLIVEPPKNHEWEAFVAAIGDGCNCKDCFTSWKDKKAMDAAIAVSKAQLLPSAGVKPPVPTFVEVDAEHPATESIFIDYSAPITVNQIKPITASSPTWVKYLEETTSWADEATEMLKESTNVEKPKEAQAPKGAAGKTGGSNG